MIAWNKSIPVYSFDEKKFRQMKKFDLRRFPPSCPDA